MTSYTSAGLVLLSRGSTASAWHGPEGSAGMSISFLAAERDKALSRFVTSTKELIFSSDTSARLIHDSVISSFTSCAILRRSDARQSPKKEQKRTTKRRKRENRLMFIFFFFC